MISRRTFLGNSLKSIALIGIGNTLQSFSADDFILPAPEDVLLRFALVSDGHYGQKDTPYGDTHRQMADWLNTLHTSRKLDFAVVNGDLFHDNPAFLPEVKTAWDRLNMKYYVTHGNHDQTPETNWEQTFGYGWHHDFAVNDNAFLILNTADIAGKYICPDLDWTARKLEQYKKHKHLFVFMHITPFKWTDNGIDCPELQAMFSKQANLRAVFHGHDHDQDSVKQHGNKHYFFDGHLGGNWGKPYHGYRTVEVLKNGTVLTWQVNPNEKTPVNNTRIKK
ncbi:metallophosphoesterase [Chitinophaga horti]|uniref:Metallophosphoesterase n=1 Tax=Chitinophaga horti TaxID=2920382 RepID=A0ABY6IWV9_9BACT|nr:metallophosphoesterase [Chitinophaga horti]UYQ91864.1 metallophosphoesterase [Chitinophaga horti]